MQRESSPAVHSFTQQHRRKLLRELNQRREHSYKICKKNTNAICAILIKTDLVVFKCLDCSAVAQIICMLRKRSLLNVLQLHTVLIHNHQHRIQPSHFLITLSISSRGTMTSSLSAAYTLFIRRLIKTKPSFPTFYQAHQTAPQNPSPVRPLKRILGKIKRKLNQTQFATCMQLKRKTDGEREREKKRVRESKLSTCLLSNTKML